MTHSLQRALAFLTLAAAGSAIGLAQHEASAAEPKPQPGADLPVVTAKGTIICAKMVQIRSEVPGTGKIAEIAAEGKLVQPGEVLVRMDASALEEQKNKQRITCQISAAAVTEARAACQRASIAKHEYLEGLYKLELQTIEYELVLATEQLRRARRELERIDQIPDEEPKKKDQREDAAFEVKRAELKAALLQTKKDVLQEYTRPKMLEQLSGEIAVAKARLAAAEQSQQLDSDRLNIVEEQLEKCVIVASFAGRVAYFGSGGSRNMARQTLRKGALVRRGQPILQLYDPNQLEFTADLHPVKLERVKEGMRATVRLDAFANLKVSGRVKSLRALPPPAVSAGPVPHAGRVTIALDSPSQELRPGFTGEVTVDVAGDGSP